MPPRSVENFVLQQGFDYEPEAVCAARYRGLAYQPRIIFAATLAAVVLQPAVLFLALAALLWWNVVVPELNPFDRIHDRLVAGPRLTPAPPPRRFSQGLSGSFALAIGLSLLAGWRPAAVTLQVILLAAQAALVFGRFCLGSYVYHLLRGRTAFANGTLPWARG